MVLEQLWMSVDSESYHKELKLMDFECELALNLTVDFGKLEPNVSSNYHGHCHLLQQTDQKKQKRTEFNKPIEYNEQNLKKYTKTKWKGDFK